MIHLHRDLVLARVAEQRCLVAVKISTRRDVLESDDVSVVDGASIVGVTIVTVLGLDLPPVFLVVLLVQPSYLLLLRPLGVVELVRVQPVRVCVCACVCVGERGDVLVWHTV